MSSLLFESVLGAFRAIGATTKDGEAYRAVRGVSVSGQGRHFRFWEVDVLSDDGRTLEVHRAPAERPEWLERPQGSTFFRQLEAAKANNEPVYGTVNKPGKPDAMGNSSAIAAAPIITRSGKPAPGQILLADARTGHLHVRFSLHDDGRQS